MVRFKDARTLAGLGGLTLAVGLVLQRFVSDWGAVDFVAGMMLGLSLVFNVKALLLWRSERANSR